MSEADQKQPINEEEATKRGYDLEVFKFFQKHNSELLDFMWDNSSPHYQGILKNTIKDERLIHFPGERYGNVAQSIDLMKRFRKSKEMKSSQQFSKEEAEKRGYDWGVVEFFMDAEPDLLDFMWDNSSHHYQGILKNLSPDEHLQESAYLQIALQGRVGNTSKASLLLAFYRLHHPKDSAPSSPASETPRE